MKIRLTVVADSKGCRGRMPLLTLTILQQVAFSRDLEVITEPNPIQLPVYCVHLRLMTTGLTLCISPHFQVYGSSIGRQSWENGRDMFTKTDYALASK